jgi:hypothetical protein
MYKVVPEIQKFKTIITIIQLIVQLCNRYSFTYENQLLIRGSNSSSWICF